MAGGSPRLQSTPPSRDDVSEYRKLRSRLECIAGATHALPQAISINPHDPDDIVEAIGAALAMPLAERRERWSAMMEHLRNHDITRWRNALLAALDDARQPIG